MTVGIAPVDGHGAARVGLEQPRDLRAGELLAPGDVVLGRRSQALAFERVAHELAPVVGGGVARAPALDLREVRGQVVGEMELGGRRRGEEDVMQGGAAAEHQHRLAGRSRLHRVDEERDRLELVRLDDAVVVGQVLLRHPVGVERGARPAAEQASRHAREHVLVDGGPEVRAREEEQRVGGRDRVRQDGRAEGARVVGRLLGDLGRDVARRRPRSAARPVPGAP